jgi:hypothetical protein
MEAPADADFEFSMTVVTIADIFIVDVLALAS